MLSTTITAIEVENGIREQSAMDEPYLIATNKTLLETVSLWISNRDEAINKYGHNICKWNTRKITGMNRLFQLQLEFNDPIRSWDNMNIISFLLWLF